MATIIVLGLMTTLMFWDPLSITIYDLTSLLKRRGFVYPGSEIYGGLAGTWDYGPLGVELKRNIEGLWWNYFVSSRDDIYGIDSAILMNPKVWEASGHVEGFHDPLVEDTVTHKRYRVDHLLEEHNINVLGMTSEDMGKALEENNVKSPEGNELGAVQQFNMMFKTGLGSVEGEEMTIYLRPETAQGTFVNFKNIVDSLHPKLPFGIAQVGRAFRNEINARDFIFRAREFEIMEFEYFVREEEWEKSFEFWKGKMWEWIELIGIQLDKVSEREIPESDRAHYSSRTIDFEYEYPFGVKELYGLAYRGDYDLSLHSKESNVSLDFLDDETNKKITPHVIEPTFGMGRTVLAVLLDAYTEDELGGEKRVFLKLKPALSPVKVAVFPLLRNKEKLVKKAREVYALVKREIPQAMWDDNGNIGKRYRRQDEIGTPHCITIDFETLENDTVTIRDRDSGKQDRIPISGIVSLVDKRK